AAPTCRRPASSERCRSSQSRAPGRPRPAMSQRRGRSACGDIQSTARPPCRGWPRTRRAGRPPSRRKPRHGGGASANKSTLSSVSEPDEHSRYYNELAGSSLHRLSGLSDGIFAVAMTLLVLSLAVPTVKEASSDSDLWQAMLKLVPGLVTYVMSFLTLGIFWVGQQTQLSQLERSNRDYTWINLAFLLFVTLVPFSTNLLANFYLSKLALIEYWLNILVLGALILAAAEYAA